ncbi:MAG: hypothetical protein ACN4GK_04275 [Acidimicrobiia bacterium]
MNAWAGLATLLPGGSTAAVIDIDGSSLKPVSIPTDPQAGGNPGRYRPVGKQRLGHRGLSMCRSLKVPVVLVLLLAACGGGAEVDEPVAEAAVVAAASEPDVVVPAGATDEPSSEVSTTAVGAQPESVPEPIAATTTTATVQAVVASEPWAPKTVDELVDPVFVVDVGFGYGIPDGWYEEVWMKAADPTGEVTGGEGVRFTGLGGSTRAGIMVDVDFEMGDRTHLVMAVHGAVLEQGLSGTGWYGREAPLAVAVRYVDAEGTEHVGLSEDPTSPGNMYFVAFSAIPEEGMINGVEVALGQPFVYQFDLMELNPAPAKVLSLVVEGAGWDPRVGEVYEIMLAAGD